MQTNRQNQKKVKVLIAVGALFSLTMSLALKGLPSDLYPRWYASLMWIETGRSIYSWTNAAEVAALTAWPHSTQLGYYYPAYMMIFTAPLALLPYDVANALWVTSGLWFFWVGTVLLAWQCNPQIAINRLTMLLVVTSLTPPVLLHIIYAQFNTIGVLSLALMYRAMCQGRYGVAGVWAAGLLFKPQATMFVLLCVGVWCVFDRGRRRFYVGLGLSSVFLWGVGEVCEPGWAVTLWQALGSYAQVESAVNTILWNPYQSVSIICGGVTLAMTVWLRRVPVGGAAFNGLVVLGLSVNALVVPMFGLVHLVLIGPMVAILFASYERLSWRSGRWVSMAVAGIVSLGTICFAAFLVGGGVAGVGIGVIAEAYRFAMPATLGLAAWPLLLAGGRGAMGQLAKS